MAKTSKLSDEEQVVDYLAKLEHPLKNVVESLKEIVLATDKEIAVQIKWNSLSFYYSGEMKPFDPKEYKRDIVVFNLNKKELVLLVFPTGATIGDDSGLLGGKFPDTRKTASFSSIEEVKSRAEDLQQVIKKWLLLVEK